MSAQHSATELSPDFTSLTLCFYGAGAMSEAIVRGLTNRKLTLPSQISMFNKQNAARLTELASQYGVNVSSDPDHQEAMLRESDIIFLSMKPKDAAEAIRKLKTTIRPGQLIVSVIAGLSMHTIEQLIGHPAAIVRTMPNTSSTIGLGATGLSFSSSVSSSQQEIAEAIFKSVGLTATVEEPLLDVVTGVSGSGPAYIYYLMEAMIQGGVNLGLSAEQARKLTVQTVLGAASMVQTTGEAPEALRKKVTSPNGTTQAALEVLEQHQVGDGVKRAIARAAERAAELGADIERSALHE